MKVRAFVLVGYLVLGAVTLIASPILGASATLMLTSLIGAVLVLTLSYHGRYNRLALGAAVVAGTITIFVSGGDADASPPEWSLYVVLGLNVLSVSSTLASLIKEDTPPGDSRRIWQLSGPYRRNELLLFCIFVFTLFIASLVSLSLYYGLDLGAASS